MKSLAGAISVNWIVDEFGVEMPAMVCEFWKAAMFAAVGACVLAFAKYAVSSLSYACEALDRAGVVPRVADRADGVEERLELAQEVLRT